MSYNMPPGSSPADYDRWMGYDQPQADADAADVAYDEYIYSEEAQEKRAAVFDRVLADPQSSEAARELARQFRRLGSR